MPIKSVLTDKFNSMLIMGMIPLKDFSEIEAVSTIVSNWFEHENCESAQDLYKENVFEILDDILEFIEVIPESEEKNLIVKFFCKNQQ